MKIIIAPQAFKGNISAFDAAKAIQKGIQRVYPAAETILNPVADGGDGTLDALMRTLGGTLKMAEAINAAGDPCRVIWGVLPDGTTAVIEMAKVCGLANMKKPNPLHATTFGLGMVIKKALDAGFREFIIGLGGSATNDAGAGMAEALGAKFLDQNNQPLAKGGLALQNLSRIDLSSLDPRIKESHFLIACDVNNPMIGQEGASRIYAPQKGAGPAEVEELEKALTRFAAIAGKDSGTLKWGGSAGGTAAGAALFLNGQLMPGIDLILEKQNFDQLLQNANLVIVGEGRLDNQTANYKAPFGIAKRAKAKNIPVIAIVGSADIARPDGIDAVMPLTFAPHAKIPRHTAELITEAAEQAMLLTTLLVGPEPPLAMKKK